MRVRRAHPTFGAQVRPGILAGVLLVACAGGGDESAVQECEALLEVYCRLVERCVASSPGPASGDQPSTYRQCVTQTDALVACEDAATVGPTYDACLQELESATCAQISGYYPQISGLRSCVAVIRLK